MFAKSKSSLFATDTSSLYIMVLVYVDEILLIDNLPSTIQNLIIKLPDTFLLKALVVLNYFLGILTWSHALKSTKDGATGKAWWSSIGGCCFVS